MAKQRTLWGLICARAEETPDKRFCLDDSGRELSFAAYRTAALRTAQGFYDLGIREGDRVAWQLPTWQESLVVAAALHRLGAEQIPLFPSLRKNELSYICGMAKPKLLITPGTWKNVDYSALATEVQQQLKQQQLKQEQLKQERLKQQLPNLQTLAVDQGGLPQAEPNISQLGPGVEETEDLPVRWIFCTSGTTSAPKAALHTDLPFITVGFGMNAVLEMSGSDVVPIYFPFTHVGGLMWLASTLLAGSQLLLADTFNAEAIAFGSANGTTIGGAGTAFHLAYYKQQQENPGETLFPGIRSFTGGGAPKPPELHYQMKEAFAGAGIISGYGLTECPIISMNTIRDPDDKLANTEGRLLPGMEIKIIKPDGSRCGPGEAGEIRVKGPHLCVGFLDEQLNQTAFDSEGYFATGDLGFLDDGGWLTISGRLKDVIIRKGENISAKKIEDLLYQHPAIADVAVIGLPDAERGELACAVVQMTTGQEELSFAAMQQFCLAHGLVIQEVPERLEVVAELPRNASGKILKNVLRERYG